MKVLLAVSPNFSIRMLEEEIANIKQGTRDFTKSVDWRPAPPIGILYIASALREAGNDVEIHDLHKAFHECREGGYFIEHDLSDFLADHFESVIKAGKYDVLGIGCLFNVSSTTVEEMGAICRKVCPSTKIVVGGHYPTNMYREVLGSGTCDYVILGEAEREFVWLNEHLDDPTISDNPHIVDLQCLNSQDKTPAVIEDPDDLPMPAWDLLPHTMDYITNSIDAERVGSSTDKSAVRSASIFTTRGCPMRCTFCAAHRVHGRVVRAHSIEYVMKHIDWLVREYDINNLLIQDDMFNFSIKRANEFCGTLYERYQDRFDIEFPNGLAVWKLNEELIANLKKVGLKSITIAVESGSPYVQKHILKKNLNLSSVREKVELIKKHGIGVRAFYIVGLVGETMEMMQETVQYALDLDIDWSEIKVFTPLAGSEMYDLAESKGYLVGDTSEHVYGRCCIETPDFTPEEAKALQYDANIRVNFLNNKSLREKRFDDAERTFRGLLRSFPDHVFAQWGLWRALIGQGKAQDAEDAFEELVELSDRSERSRALLDRHGVHLQRRPEIARV